MKDTLFYIDEIKKKQGIKSDYAVAKLLGISRQLMPKLKSGRTTFDSNLAFKVAELTGHDPAEIVLDMKAMKEKDPDFSKKWAELARRVAQASGSAAAGVILSAAVLAYPAESRAAVDSPTSSMIPTLYIM